MVTFEVHSKYYTKFVFITLLLVKVYEFLMDYINDDMKKKIKKYPEVLIFLQYILIIGHIFLYDYKNVSNKHQLQYTLLIHATISTTIQYIFLKKPKKQTVLIRSLKYILIHFLSSLPIYLYYDVLT
jgi:hypothetical protein